MQETEGPSQEGIGETPGGDFGLPLPEEIGEKFKHFLDREKSEGFKVIDRDSNRLFSIREAGPDEFKTTYREYYGFGQDADGQVKFYEISYSGIRESFIELSKIGRPDVVIDETETIVIHRDSEGYRVKYIIGNPKAKRLNNPSGEIGATTYFMVGYSNKGELSELDIFPNTTGKHGGTLLHPNLGKFGSIDEMERFVEDVKRIKENGLNVEVENDDSDEENKLFVITIFGDGDNPEYQFIVPKSINVGHVLAETGALELWKDPHQPSDGVPGKSFGDREWRSKPFENIIRIKLKLL